MSIVSNIFFSYFSPVKIFNDRIIKKTEGQLFGVLVFGCLITFISRFPLLYYRSLSSLDPLIGMFSANLVAVLFITPLFFYVCSGIFFLVFRLFKFRVTSLQSRMSLFWSFALVSPWGLVNSLIKVTNCPIWFEISFSIFIFLIFCMFFYYFLKVCLEYKG